VLQKAEVDLANEICKNDPVRPNLPLGWRVEPNWKEVFYLDSRWGNHRGSIKTIDAVLCVAHLNEIPINEDELLSFGVGDISVFYSVWSNRKGCGRKIVFDTLDLFLKSQHPNNRYVTMSPKTKMAMKFHIDNGAKLLQENPVSYNFEYTAIFEYE